MYKHTLVARRITILTTTYNRRDYLELAIRSVLRQTVPDWEQLVIDDGSTDDTQETMAKQYDPRVCYIRQKHTGIEGLGRSLNKALGESHAPLIALLEDDDYWPRDRLALQLPAMKGSVLSYGRVRYIDSQSKVIGGPSLWLSWPRNKKVLSNTPPGNILRRLARNYFIPGATAMLERNALLEVGGFIQPNGLSAIDYATFLALSLKGRFRALSSILAYVRRHYASAALIESSRIPVIEATFRYVHDFLVNEAKKGNLPRELWYLTHDSGPEYQLTRDMAELIIVRRMLLAKKGAEARQRMVPLLGSKSWQVKGLAAIGILASSFGMNIEWPLQTYGVAPLT
jgi:glycosyltransferase involved in cell wall biosynthesis